MLHRLIQKGNAYFAKDWRIMAFQPVLYLFVWGASIRLWANQTEPVNFEIIDEGFYGLWLALGIVGPMLTLLSWFLIQKCSGRWRFMGMWTRFSADIMVLTCLLTFHIASVADHSRLVREAKIFSRYILGASIVFVGILVIRDLWALIITERLASRIHLGRE